MNQADIGPNASSNAPLANVDAPAQAPASSGTSAFAVLVGIAFLLMTTFFVLSFWAVWKRSEGLTTQLAPSVVEQSTTSQSSDRTDSEMWLDAMVNLKRLDRGPGQLRDAPSGASIAEFGHKASVKVAAASVKNHEKWYRVRGMYKGSVVEGWMHSDIVLVEQQP